MTQLASDDFNRVDGVLGANWTARSGDGSTFGIVSNAATPGSLTSGDVVAVYTGTAASADQYSEVAVTVTGAGSGAGFGVVARASTSVGTCYRLVGGDAGNPGCTELAKEVSGVFTSLATSTAIWNPGDIARIEAQSNAIRAFRSGTQIFLVTDSSIASGGWGIVYSSTAVSGSVDNWAGGSFSGAAAALAGGATAATAATGALSSGIRLAGALTSVASANGFLMGLMAAAGVNVASSASLATSVQLAAAAFSPVTATANLFGVVQLSGSAVAATSAAAALTNWTTVTLTAPLYTGQGGLLDPHLWLDSKPTVGTVVYYDSTHLTIAPDGQLSSDVTDCTAVVQFFDGANWALGIVRLTSGLASYADLSAVSTGVLSNAIVLLAAANIITQASGSLNTQIKFQGAAQAVTTASASLASSIQLLAAVTDDSSGSGTLQGTVNQLAANATVSTSASAFLNAQIQLAASAASLVSATGALAAHILFRAAALNSVSTSGTLVTGTQMTAAAAAASAATGALLTAIRIAGPALTIVQAAGNLTNHIDLLSNAVVTTAAQGGLSTFTGLQANAQSVSSAVSSLVALITMRSSAFSISQSDASLLTQIPLQGGVLATDTVGGDLSATGSSVGLYPVDPFFVIGVARRYFTEQFPQVAPGDYKILTFNFADSLPTGVKLQGNISLSVEASAGADPGLPADLLIAPAAYDTTLTQVEQPIHAQIKDNDYYFTVTAPTTNPYVTVTRFGMLSVRA